MVGTDTADTVEPGRHEPVERVPHEGKHAILRMPVEHLREFLAAQHHVEPRLRKVAGRRGVLPQLGLDRRPATFRDVDECALVSMRDHERRERNKGMSPRSRSARTVSAKSFGVRKCRTTTRSKFSGIR